MALQLFMRERPIKDGIARVCLFKNGSFGLNAVCRKRWFENYEYVTMYFDAERNVVGIKPTREQSVNTYCLSRGGTRGLSASFTARAFLTHWGIKTSANAHYTATWNELENLLEIDLNKPLD